MIILRDMKESDIQDYVNWYTEEKEWMYWDLPGQNYESNKEKELEKWAKYYENMSQLEIDALREKYEIEVDGNHIGWVSCYENFYKKRYDEIFIKVVIPEIKYRNKGYGTKALQLYMAYLIEKGYQQFHIETWSGNIPMKEVIKKMHFMLNSVNWNSVNINGELYNKEKYISSGCIWYENETYYVKSYIDKYDPRSLDVYEAQDLNSPFLKQNYKKKYFFTNKKNNTLKLDCQLLHEEISLIDYHEIDISNLIMPNVKEISLNGVKKIIGLEEFMKNNSTLKVVSFYKCNISLLGEEFWSSLRSDMIVAIGDCRRFKSLKGLKGIKLLNISGSFIEDGDETNLYKCESALYKRKMYSKDSDL